MAKVNSKEKEELRREAIEQQISSTDRFFKENRKTIWAVAAAVVVIGFGVLAYTKWVYQPKCVEAQQQTFPAERSFQAGEYELALNGDGNNLGFAEIIREYGKKGGSAVYLYAGICELQLGNYEQSLSYLRKYRTGEPIMAARAKACEGDALVALGKVSEAVGAYKAAVAKGDNIFAAGYLLKQGIAHESLGQKAEALACYESIKEDYPQSLEAYEIAKYIARVSE